VNDLRDGTGRGAASRLSVDCFGGDLGAFLIRLFGISKNKSKIEPRINDLYEDDRQSA
jgi:hypothetical protein